MEGKRDVKEIREIRNNDWRKTYYKNETDSDSTFSVIFP